MNIWTVASACVTQRAQLSVLQKASAPRVDEWAEKESLFNPAFSRHDLNQ